ncbi:LCCL domain-containing protein [Fomitiporia mediterranea MF3/22]|uniref:LCCL domain-containing protein n=1 Tax=Fomitiporia mediterranea (strain MF3/22) TaxID=694068 RepID=UPI0004408C71|nr:LCCL domain-containing protein [Fomitiporia mediterranea MF3/22]EJD04064.1 LCCL domain-containing protein [Fomitiporia mediterranea MF3/22]
MAAPPEVNTLDLSGMFIMNKTLSDDPDEILRLQGVSWFKRKIISTITITLYVSHYKDDEGKEHIDIRQIGSGGFEGNFERRIVDWTLRSTEDPLFGAVVGRSRRIKVDDLEYEWHKENWSADTIENCAIESYVESDTPKSGTTWVADQVWGFSEINSERRYVRRIHFTGPDGEDLHRVLVYDYHPTPVLNRSYKIRGRTVTLGLEQPVLRWTRPLTSKWLLACLVVAYIIALSFLTRTGYFLVPSDSWVGCTATYWLANDGCGLNGDTCGPFDNSTFDFRCPAQCTSTVLANPRTIGNIQIDNVPVIVGGGDDNRTYRGDSFICAAAVHAGLFEDSHGGCGTLQLTGNFTNFLALAAHGLMSAPFPTIFPLSYRFSQNTSLSHCLDLRNHVLAFNIIVTALLFLVFRPKPIILYWSLVCIGFWHISLYSQPQGFPPPLDTAFGIFLPTLFFAYAFWRLAFRFVLPAFSNAPLERAVWYLAAFWPGVLLNIVTDKIPVDRLVASDIDKRPGALIAIIIIAIVVFVIVVNQIRVIRKTGWLPKYLAWYIAGGLVALVLSQLPNLTLRLHHYIFAMVMIPGTAFPTRLSAIYQAFLLGMFLNGVAAFGYDSILQTAADLQRDAPQGSALPTFLTNSTTYNSSIPLLNQTISWAPIPDDGNGFDGFALLIDDVERFTGTALNFSLASLQEGIPHFFRLAFQKAGVSGDFTKAATLWPNGSWVNPLPGPS